MTDLKKTLLDNIEIQEEVDKKFAQLIRRSTWITTGIVALMAFVVVIVMVIVTKPIGAERELVEHLKQERIILAQERARIDSINKKTDSTYKVIAYERTLLNQERQRFLEMLKTTERLMK